MEHTILLVDDDANLLNALKRAFRHAPYQVVTACGAAPALEILATTRVSVVVSDQDMPGMRGTEFLAQVRDRWPDTMRMILTGLGSLETAIEAINGGEIYRFFTKPCHPDELAVAIRQALQQRELLVQGRRLLATVQHQSQVLASLESEHPGITQVVRGDDDSILIDETADLETFLRKVNTELCSSSSS